MALDGRARPNLPENAPQSVPSEADVIAFRSNGGADSESGPYPPRTGRRGEEHPDAPAGAAPEFESREDSEKVENDLDFEKKDKYWKPGRFFRGLVSSGYRVENETLYRAWNLALVVPLIVLTLPLFVAVAALLLLTQGRPILYKGVRLGRHGKPFQIYKFCTLREGAEALTRDQVLPSRSNLETPLGRLLREGRLDELPQLFNILRGDMNFLGPRPVRAEIAEELVDTIANYELRFSVKPGLVGQTQAFMTHRTPKRLRSLYNAFLVRRTAHIWKEPIILAWTAWSVCSTTVAIIVGQLRGMVAGRSLVERRQVRRMRPGGATVYLLHEHEHVRCGPLMDINDEVFTLMSERELGDGDHIFMLTRTLNSRNKEKRAICKGEVELLPLINGVAIWAKRSGHGALPFRYLVRFTPITDFNRYKIDRYFLENSLIS